MLTRVALLLRGTERKARWYLAPNPPEHVRPRQPAPGVSLPMGRNASETAASQLANATSTATTSTIMYLASAEASTFTGWCVPIWLSCLSGCEVEVTVSVVCLPRPAACFWMVERGPVVLLEKQALQLLLFNEQCLVSACHLYSLSTFQRPVHHIRCY